MGKDNVGVAAAPPGQSGYAPSPVPGLGHSATVPNADELESKTPYQIATMMGALSTFITEWAKVVESAEEQARKDRELLAGAMADLTRLSHYVARKGAMALERASDSDRSGEAGETATQIAGSTEGESAGPKGIARNGSSPPLTEKEQSDG